MGDFEQTFDHATLDYEESRPLYPDALFQDLFAYCPVNHESCVLEIGAGTGKATLPVALTGCRLTALEPGEHLIEFARRKIKKHPNVSLLREMLQDFECAPETFDLIYAATAFHWIPEAYGYRRVYELLKYGGTFARFAYHAGPDTGRPEMTEEIQRVYDRIPALAQKGIPFGQKQAEALANLAFSYGFADAKVCMYQATRDFSADAYMQLLRTYPAHMKLEESERKDLFSGIHNAIIRHGGTITVYYTFDMELSRKV